MLFGGSISRGTVVAAVANGSSTTVAAADANGSIKNNIGGNGNRTGAVAQRLCTRAQLVE